MSKIKNIIITGCNDCPFCDRFFEQQIADCNVYPGDETMQLSNDIPITPTWCPLKQLKHITVGYES